MSPHGSDRSLARRARRAPRRASGLVSALGVSDLGVKALVVKALGVGLAFAALSGCSTQDLPRFGMPTPATHQGGDTLRLWQGSWIAALTVGAVVWGLIVWSVIFHRRSRHADEVPPQTRYNVPIEVLYTVVPFVIIAVLFFYTARNENRLVQTSVHPDETINVVGRQWSWTFNYLNGDVWDAGTQGQPPTLYLPRGERVRFELSSPDVIHSFWVPAFLFKMDIIPGVHNSFEVTPRKEGTFAGKCAELCGVDHSKMLFTVKVVSSKEYQEHLRDLAARKQTGSVPGVINQGDKPGRGGKAVVGVNT